MVAFCPERAVTEGAVIRSTPFFCESPRMITCTCPSEKRPVRPRMPGAALAFCALRFGLFKIASMLLRSIALSPLRKPPVTILVTFPPVIPGIAGFAKAAAVLIGPFPSVPPAANTSPPTPKGETIQSKPSSSLFSWEISTNFVVIFTCFGCWPANASTSCSILSSSEGVLVIRRLPEAPRVAELPSEKRIPACFNSSIIGGRAVRLPAPDPAVSENGSTSAAPAPPAPPALSEAAKSGGTRKVRVKRSSPVSVCGTSVTAKSSTL